VAAASPLARVADQSLFAPSAHPILSSSFAGAMVAAEALVSGMMMSNRDNVAHAARLTDAISAYLYRGDSDRPKR
jgi:DNA-binding MurR/RpiR family transcriptional regulator